MPICRRKKGKKVPIQVYEALIIPPRIVTLVSLDGKMATWRIKAVGKLFARTVLGITYSRKFPMDNGSTRTVLFSVPKKRLIRTIGFRKIRGGGYEWLKICGYTWRETWREI